MFQEQMSSLLLFPNLYKVLIGSFGENVRIILVVSHGVALNIDMEWKRWKMAG